MLDSPAPIGFFRLHSVTSKASATLLSPDGLRALRGGLARRAGLVASVFVLGSVIGIMGGESASDAKELAASLGRASGTVVQPEDIKWEPSRGALLDLVSGRFVLFLGSEAEGAPRDLYRASVRVSPEGRVVAIGTPHDLTQTPLGDDHALVVRGSHAAFATFAYGQEQSVTSLDLDGEGAQNVTKKLHDRAMAWVTNLQRTGAGEGVGRVDVTLDQPAQRVGLALGEATLDISLADDDRTRKPTRTARLDLEKGDLVGTPPGMHAQAGTHLPKKLAHWGVDTVRAISWIGPEPITWLEEKTFAAKDTVKKLAFKVGGGGEALARSPDDVAPPPIILDPSQASADLGHWPPPPIRSIWKTPEAGEGEWVVPKQTWIKKLPAFKDSEAPPSAFYTSFVRPDEERPYSKVLFVAMDMRQLDLDMEAGTEDPKPLTGAPGSGRIPREPAIYQKIAAAWNGGFKTEHGAYGMMLKKRVLLPPMPGIATVVMTKDHRVGMGSWGTSKDVNGAIVDLEGADVVSFRQNLDPLLDNDKVNPLGRTQWGFTLPGTGMQTERSGICITNAGHLLYAWGDDVSATSLGKGMKMAGCVYGMHLDMNPHHTGFLFTNIETLKDKGYKSELLSNQMEIDTNRYILYAPKDFFYVTLHDGKPPALEGAKGWEPDVGVQPAPAWMPGVWRATSGDVEITEIEPARASFRVRAGTKEPGVSQRHELEGDDAKRVLFALSLGTAPDGKRHAKGGLVNDGKNVLPMLGGEHVGVLVASEDGQLSIASAPPKAGRFDAVELPLLVDDAKVVGTHARVVAALGLTPQGRVYVARSKNGTAEDVGGLLKKAGCIRAVVLDRGAGTPGALARAGTSTPPRARYEDTTIYAMGRALVPRGFKFEPTHPVEPPAPKKK